MLTNAYSWVVTLSSKYRTFLSPQNVPLWLSAISPQTLSLTSNLDLCSAQSTYFLQSWRLKNHLIVVLLCFLFFFFNCVWSWECFCHYGLFSPFLEFHKNGIRSCMLWGIWLLSLSVMFLKFAPVLYTRTLFLFIAEKHSKIWIYQNSFISSLADSHFGYFQFCFAVMNKASMNTHVQVFV